MLIDRVLFPACAGVHMSAHGSYSPKTRRGGSRRISPSSPSYCGSP